MNAFFVYISVILPAIAQTIPSKIASSRLKTISSYHYSATLNNFKERLYNFNKYSFISFLNTTIINCKVMNRFHLSISIALFFYQLSFCQNGLQESIDQFTYDPIFKNASLGIAVFDVESGKLLAGSQENLSLVPASSLKVITTATALSLFGEDYQFKTELQYEGTIQSDGTLDGNIYIKGFGDPTLGSVLYDQAVGLDDLMEAFAQEIKKAGIKRVNGKIIGDASYFENEVVSRKWLYEDLGNYYGAGTWGLNIHENMYYLDFGQNAKVGGKTQFKQTRPAIPNLLIVNEVTSGKASSGDNAYIFGAPYQYTCFVRGTIPAGAGTFTIKGAIPDPPFFAAHALTGALIQNGIEVLQPASTLFEMARTGQSSGETKLIYTHRSPKLKAIIKRTNLKSVNLYCEAMLRAIGKKVSNKGSIESGVSAIVAFWKERGVDLDGFHMVDGSGLSPKNAVTAKQLAAILRKIAKDEKIKKVFFDSLPLGGKSGSLKNLIKSAEGIGNIMAKSGYMEKVMSFSGYVKDKKGRLLSFSIIGNNFKDNGPTRKKIGLLMEKFCK